MRLLIFTAAVFAACQLNAQDHFCGATEVQNKWFAEHPELKARFDRLQAEAEARDRDFFNKSIQQRTAISAPNFTIPVVFHILHQGGSENISELQVRDAVDILNRDFRKQNADTSIVVAAFQNIIGDAKIEFRLATLDPNGVCTDGIIRHWDPNTNWTGNWLDYVYTWDPTQYLNVYVVKSMNSNAAGYTFLPGSGIPPDVDAIVMLSNYVGSIGTGNVGTSRTLTHETGHWLDLPHVWGGTNNPGVACGDDGVGDTPVTKGFSNCTLNNSTICTPGVPENIQNYMEYSYCSRMFTNGQAFRMQNAAASTVSGRNNLSTPTNLANTGVTNPGSGCIPALTISLPGLTVCSGKTLSFASFTSNANPTSYAWSANNGAIVNNPSAANASVQFVNTGITTVSCTVSNANGSASASRTITVVNGVPQITALNVESFETSNNVPAQWSVINNGTPLQKWEVTSAGAASGANSMFVPGEAMPPNSIEILETPSYDFLNNPGALFFFSYAYARKNPSNKDVFKLQASKDCGGTWTNIWEPSNASLANSSASDQSAVLYPASYNWVLIDVISMCPAFFPFTSEPNVRFRFYFQEDPGGAGFGNRFYLDDINFANALGVNEITKAIGLHVYPNPSGSVFHLGFTLSNTANIRYEVVSVTGAVLQQAAERSFGAGSHELIINREQNLANGVYFLNFEMNGVKMSKKLVVN
jgi:hypothetical protein